MKRLYCEGCKIKVAKIKDGSFIKKGMVVLCSKCERLRKISDLGTIGKKNSLSDTLNDILKR